MNGGGLRGLVARLRETARPTEAGAPADAELLRRWVTQADQVAFELLLRRHGPMVLGVCRRLLRRAQDVEDAFQATFLTLVRKAGSISKGQVVGSWLYTVASRVALQARAGEARHETSGPSALDLLPGPGTPSPEWELRAVLDEEVSRLPERYRVVVVLCYFEGKTNEEAARELGRPVGTITSRLARAREQLRVRLARRGLAPATWPLVLSLPAGLVGSTLKAATAVATGQATLGAISAPAAALTEGALHAMFMVKVKVAAVVLLAVVVLGTGGAWGYWTATAGSADGGAGDRAPLAEGPGPGPAVAPKALRKDELRLKLAANGKKWSEVFRWLSDATGKPVVTTFTPTGTFRVKAPPYKRFTVNEVIDLINENLADNNLVNQYLLIDRERCYALVVAEKGLPPDAFPRIKVEDLPRRARTELASVILSPKSLDVTEVGVEVKKMLGRVGDVQVDARTNQLILRDQVGNLTRIVNTLQELDRAEVGKAPAARPVGEAARDEVEVFQAQAEVKRAQLTVAKAALVPARAKLARMKGLAASGSIAAEVLDQAQADVRTAEGNVIVKEAELREAMVHLRQAERRAAPPRLPEARKSPQQRLAELERKLAEMQREVEALRRVLGPAPRPR